ncbi:hypothetical protein HOG16_02710 [Candidatus Woesearchaeota archaeon]|jgi:hypothetical protein|nr:hypothetical protein [Candidatus Woesearchaeota archaeon]MBT4322009.1 hypothetical protein [Candidatus Woesearchaeota archaeon]MBT4630755.1 hypothetical protein [Candidatus Woesearchaeota archaeon]
MENLYFKALDLELPNPSREGFVVEYSDDGYVDDFRSHYRKLALDFGVEESAINERLDADLPEYASFFTHGVTFSLKSIGQTREDVEQFTHIAYHKNDFEDFELFTRMHEEAHAIEYIGGSPKEILYSFVECGWGMKPSKLPEELRQNVIALCFLDKKGVNLEKFLLWNIVNEFSSLNGNSSVVNATDYFVRNRN